MWKSTKLAWNVSVAVSNVLAKLFRVRSIVPMFAWSGSIGFGFICEAKSQYPAAGI